MRRDRNTVASSGCIVFSAIVVLAMCITIISINRQQLYNVDTWCSYYPYSWYTQCVSIAHQCWASPDPLNDMTNCQYLYSLGAVGIFFQFWIALIPCLDSMMAVACMGMMAFANFGWWLAGGIYFTQQFNQIDSSQSAGDYRNAIEGVTWTAFAMSTVQALAMIAAVCAARRAAGQPQEQEVAYKPQEMVPPPQPVYAGNYTVPPAAYPPPPPGYGAPPPVYPAPAYYAAPPPPAGYPDAPPAAGYPAAVPPPPAGV